MLCWRDKNALKLTAALMYLKHVLLWFRPSCKQWISSLGLRFHFSFVASLLYIWAIVHFIILTFNSKMFILLITLHILAHIQYKKSITVSAEFLLLFISSWKIINKRENHSFVTKIYFQHSSITESIIVSSTVFVLVRCLMHSGLSNQRVPPWKHCGL